MNGIDNILLIERIAPRLGLRLFWWSEGGKTNLCTWRERFVRPVFIGAGPTLAAQADDAAASAVAVWAWRGPSGLLSEW